MGGGLGRFEIVVLGGGDEGDSCWIFGGEEYVVCCFDGYEKRINGYKGEGGIGMRGCVVLSGRKVILLIRGKKKREVVYEIVKWGDRGGGG